jgi:hypothetical protein
MKILPYENSPLRKFSPMKTPLKKVLFLKEYFVCILNVFEVGVIRIRKEFRSSLVYEAVLRPELKYSKLFLKISKYHDIFYIFEVFPFALSRER